MEFKKLYGGGAWHAVDSKYDWTGNGFSKAGHHWKDSGFGNAINGVTEVALGTAVIIRNGIGVVGIIILVCIGIRPVIRLALLAFLYKLLAAVVQPVSDKRMTGALSTIGNGYVLFLKVLLCMELLIFITIAILSISFIGK